MVNTVWSLPISSLSIHRIRTHNILPEAKAPQDIISQIIENYLNINNTRLSEGQLEHQEVKSLPWDASQHHAFQLKIHQFAKKGLSPLGELLGSVQGSKDEFLETSFYFVIFFYRAVSGAKIASQATKMNRCWDIYALTHRDGWMVIKPYSDYNFPINIALRTIEPRLSTVETKALAGDKEASTETYRTVYRLQSYEHDTLWRVFKVFVSTFKENSSLYALEAFKDKKQIGVQLGRSKLVILSQIPFTLYPEILHHFSKIHRRNPDHPTHNVDGAIEEDDPSFKYLTNIRPVDDTTSQELNKQLAQYLFEYFQGTRRNLDLSVCHRYYRDYYMSTWFTLHYHGNQICWNSPPSFQGIMTCLRHFSSVEKRSLDSPLKVLELLEHAHLRYSRGERHNRDFPLIEFLGGEIRDSKTHQVFFRNDGIWLRVAADHLVTLQSTFYALLNEPTLIPKPRRSQKSTQGWLPLPWIAKEQWASFTIQDAQEEGIDQNEIGQVVKILKIRTYSFVSKKGKVLVPYLTPCILENVTERKLSKLLDKRWTELCEFLQEKEGQVIQPKDLEEIFPNTQEKTSEEDEDVVDVDTSQLGMDETPSTTQPNRKHSSRAQQVYDLLTQKRSICTELSAGRGAKWPMEQLVHENGMVLQADLTGIHFKLKSAMKNLDWIEKYLTQCQKSGKPLQDKDFIYHFSGLKGIGKKNAKKVLKSIKDPVERRCAFKGCIIVQFPPRMKGMDGIMLSNGAPVSQDVWDFLNKRHEAYKKVCKEEGYNRQYLGKKGYIVCDQVYAGTKEKVELFDVLYHDTKTGKLYLYHIKEKFGQPTREACAQIRVAAQTLARDRAEKYPHLKSLHEKAMNSKGKSSFQKSVKKQFDALCPESSGSNEGLLKLFDKDPKDIIFVYAFIDTGSPERRLEQELDPTHVFSQTDFPSERIDVCTALKEKGYLNKSSKLTRNAIKASKEKFKDDFEDLLINYDVVFHQLKKYTSQFDSMGAKLELLHLRDHIRTQFSFGFEICQIDRTGCFSESSDVIESLEADVGDGVGEPDEVHFRYDGQEYRVETTPSTYSEGIWHILGYPTKTHTLLKKLHFSQSLVHITGNAEEELDTLLEGRFPNIMTTKDRIQTYIDQVIWKALFSEEDLEIAAWVAERNCLVFEQSPNDEQDLEIKTEVPKCNFNEESLDIVCIVQRTAGGSFLCHTKDEQASRLTFPVHWGSITIPLLPTGIKNSGTDCFVNAALQLIIHTSLFKLFEDERLLLLDDAPGNYDFDPTIDGRAEKIANERKRRQEIFRRLRNFLMEYALRSKESLACAPPSQLRTAISELNTTSPDMLKSGHQDTAELFALLQECYNTSGYCSIFSKKMIPDRDDEEDITLSLAGTQTPLTQYSTINDSGLCEIERDKPFCLEVPLLPQKELTCQDCFNAYLNETTTTEWKYAYGSQVFLSQASTQITVLSKPQKGLLVSYKRFNSDGTKIHTPVILDSLTLDFDSTPFALKGFIVHKGTTLKSGHYVTYCFCQTTNKWCLFDDNTIAIQTEDKVKTAVQNAYVLFFEPSNPFKTSPTIQINLNAEFGGNQSANQHQSGKSKRTRSESKEDSEPTSHKKARIEQKEKSRTYEENKGAKRLKKDFPMDLNK